MLRTIARRGFPVVAWSYLVALGIQIFFAGMFVFVGASSIELHRNFAHVIGLLSFLLFVTAFVGRVDGAEKRLVFATFALLILQGMLVHVHQWFVAPYVAALHPVNAMLMTWVAYTLARRASAYWAAGEAARAVRRAESGATA